METTIFIPGNTPSLKNSKIMGRFPSKTVMKWLRTFGIQHYSASKKEVKYFKRIKGDYNLKEILAPIKLHTNYPLLVYLHFIRNSKRRWDFGNGCQILQDLMVAFDVIPDDDTTHLLPFPLEIDKQYWKIDEQNPGVIITIKD